MVKNLNIVLDTTVRHRQQFDQTVDNLEVLITGLKNHADPLAAGTANISNAAGTVADLLAEDRGSAAQDAQLSGRGSAAAHRPA